MKNRNIKNRFNFASLLGDFFEVLGVGLFSYLLFIFGEYLADYHFNGTMNVYCACVLTVCIYFGLKGFIRAVKRQKIYQKNMKRIDNINRKALLDYHPHHHKSKYWI